MFVMLGALGVNIFTFDSILKNAKPLLCVSCSFDVSKNKVVDLRLIIGSAIFGVGWGLGGFCPGPGMINLFTSSYILYWIIGLTIG